MWACHQNVWACLPCKLLFFQGDNRNIPEAHMIQIQNCSHVTTQSLLMLLPNLVSLNRIGQDFSESCFSGHLYSPSHSLCSSSDTCMYACWSSNSRTFGFHSFLLQSLHLEQSPPRDQALTLLVLLSFFINKLKTFLFSRYFNHYQPTLSFTPVVLLLVCTVCLHVCIVSVCCMYSFMFEQCCLPVLRYMYITCQLYVKLIIIII